MRHPGAIFSEFRDDESGNAAIELLLCLPILVWALLSTIVYFDAYHDEAISTRAGLTIADMFSREDAPVDSDYMNGAHALLTSLTGVTDRTSTADTYEGSKLRVTVYEYVQANDVFRVIWSENIGFGVNYTDANLANLRSALPDIADGDTAILVETTTTYNAPFAVSISPFIVPNLDGVEFKTFTVISPRFAESICWDRAGDDDLCRLSNVTPAT